ncbi:hypothetical protein ASC95_26440 [Pelomonas sp. Root1217]|uniref:2OG-Fe(II) oxygenase n=1 Tax=Pelomonas sp. Root1217 TaxID=1736430 RepID=UPI000709FC23|nr:2OG-Fe(II) oxygenase [Pelomonas sp. Root1217]KQV47047.1 hypothetical protein ASC95_26440 [Pelomonas sp. Root1217]
MDQISLKAAAQRCAAKLLDAVEGQGYFDEPYRHIVVDDFFDLPIAKACLDHFPALSASGWEHANDADIEVKFRTTWKSEFDIPEGLVDAVRILNSSLVLDAMGRRIGVEKLVPDPYFTGGGLNVTLPGGLLDVHVDGNYHDATGLTRRLNAIVYLNPGWQPGWGGEFGIYDRTGQNCVKRVEPLFNRLVVFDSHDFSFHGLPEPITFPPGTERRSLILYYYTRAARPAADVAVGDPHSALWVKRGVLDKRGNKTRPAR